MRTLRRNETKLYLCNKHEDEDVFDVPYEINVNIGVVKSQYVYNQNGIIIDGTQTIVFDNKKNINIKTGDRLYYSNPLVFDNSASNADLLVTHVFKGLNFTTAYIKNRWN